MSTQLDPTTFRPGTLAVPRRARFVIGNCGMGDKVAYLSALKWIMETQPQVQGTACVHSFFVPFARKILNKWVIDDIKTVNRNENILIKFPMSEEVNATGQHLIDLGFIYYANLSPVPAEWNYYVELPQTMKKPPFAIDKHMPYAVMTPGATVPTRTMPPKVFNSLKDYIVSLGITPVFLGKTQIQDTHHAKFEVAYDYSGGINLIDRTDLFEAAEIMRHAKFVIGLDNGLLHLAATTEVPIIFGYNIASPTHRRPRRRKGAIYDVVPDEGLACRFCQSKMRFLAHHFSDCLYKDLLCLDHMTAKKYIDAIDLCLREQLI